jgi:hypothetical protein
MNEPQLTVVVAIEDSAANLGETLAHLAPAAHPQCEFIVCAADRALLRDVPADAAPALRTMVCAAGSHVPQMWRDGIVAARAPWVALLSAHVVPTSGWLDALLALQPAADLAGVGGWFAQPAGARARDWAVYLLRYAAFSQPVDDAMVSHIAADNAVYRRAAVLACADLVERGFWEVEYHVRFRAQGLWLALKRELEVTHVNRYAARSFAQQRRQHGFAFGSDRARRVGRARALLLLVMAPLAPAVLLAKVLSRARRFRLLGRTPWAAYPWLVWFVGHWCWGEARGTLSALMRTADART